MKQLSKKDLLKKKPNIKEAAHYEGKHFCNCRTRNFRKWLGLKKYGFNEINISASPENSQIPDMP